jgi:phosphoesterase RecJ-like protein
MLAVAALLEGMNKRVGCYIPGVVSEKYKTLPRMKLLLSEEEVKNFQYDIAFVLDTPTLERGGSVISADDGTVIINIDHHPKDPILDALNLVNIHASATCEIIYNFFNPNLHLHIP